MGVGTAARVTQLARTIERSAGRCARTVENMRRITTVLVLAMLSGTLAVPLLNAAFSDLESDLPPCCRSRGQHHCAMMDQYLRMKASSAPAFTAPSSHCPLYPRARTQSWAPFAPALLPGRSAVYAALRSHPACQAQTLARYRVSFDRSRLKRGPPALPLA